MGQVDIYSSQGAVNANSSLYSSQQQGIQAAGGKGMMMQMPGGAQVKGPQQAQQQAYQQQYQQYQQQQQVNRFREAAFCFGCWLLGFIHTHKMIHPGWCLKEILKFIGHNTTLCAIVLFSWQAASAYQQMQLQMQQQQQQVKVDRDKMIVHFYSLSPSMVI